MLYSYPAQFQLTGKEGSEGINVADAAGECQRSSHMCLKEVKTLSESCFPSCVQVWDDELERSATHWAEQCQWDHGPQDLLMSIGQNLAVHWGR